MKDFNKKNTYQKQQIPILINFEERDQWENWPVCGVKDLDKENGMAIHLSSEKTKMTYKNMRKQ